MKLFGIVIATQKTIDAKIAKACKDIEENLESREQRVSDMEKEYNEYWDRRAKEVAAAWKEIEEAKASLILKEIANVMGGHWRS